MTAKSIYLLATGSVPEEAVQEAAKRGVVLESMEYIRTESLTELPGIEQLIARQLKVVFTSANAVKAVQRWIEGTAPHWQVYCISGATNHAAEKLFGKQAIAATANSASQLAELIRQRETDQGAGMIFFCGDHRKEELPSIGVTEIVVYRTVLTPQPIRRNYEAIAFFSPSAVESFFSVNVIAADIPLFAIGSSTAEAIGMRCKNPVMIGELPDKAALIHQMTDHFLNKQ